MKCIYCKNNVDRWCDEVCALCTEKTKKKFQFPDSCKLHIVSDRYIWRQHGVSCYGKPVLKK